jgi:hypothetical protein
VLLVVTASRVARGSIALAVALATSIAGAESSSPRPAAERVPVANAARVSFPWRERALAPYGMLTASAGLTSRTYTLAVGDGEPKRNAEGDAADDIWLGLEYAIPVLPFLNLRAYAQHSSYSTPLALSSGYGSYQAYDFGIAPGTAVVLQPSHGPPTIVGLAVPLGLSLSHLEHEPPRDTVAERWSTGKGFRVGVLGSAVLVVMRHLGITTDLWLTWTDVHQPVEYRALDGSGRRANETLRFASFRTDLSVGLVWIL